MGTQQKSYIGALTATRAIAAVMVFVHHNGYDIFPFKYGHTIFHSGNVAVSYFFVLSGFVLYLAHINKPLQYAYYIKKRIARIAPLYFIGLFLTVYLVSRTPPWPADIKQQIIYCSLFIQAFIPGYTTCLNFPAWSISVEMFFYVIFPALLFFLRTRIKWFTLLFAALFILSHVIHLKFFPQRYGLSDSIVDPIFFNPLIHISQFMIGMLGGFLYKKIEYKPMKVGYVPVMVFVIILFLIAYRPDNVSYHVGLLAPLFMVLIIAIAKSKSRILNFPFFIFLGEISYGFYILQHPVYTLLDMVCKKFGNMPSDLFFYFSLVVLFAIAAILYLVVERPLMRWITKRG